MKLTPEQSLAVHAKNHLAVIAVPGAGKTFMLVSRAVHLLNQGYRVTALTFTRSAAQEIAHRCSQQTNSPGLVTGTLHAVAIRQALVMGVKVLFPNQSSLLLKSAWQTMQCVTPLNEVQAFVDSLGTHSTAAYPSDLIPVIERYIQLLSTNTSVDFSSLLHEVGTAIMERKADPLETDYLLLDETQDLDPQQLYWAIAHAHSGIRVTIVGDDDQSIYGFRNSMGVGVFQEFNRILSPQIVSLTTNYRSHSEILDAANRVISLNKARIPKNLVSHKGSGGHVQLHRYSTCDDEVQAILDWITREKTDTAVIARRNIELDLIEESLISYDIPYTRHGGKDFWSNPTPSLFINCLDLVKKPSRSLALTPVLSHFGLPTDNPAVTAYLDYNKQNSEISPHQLKMLDALKMYIQRIRQSHAQRNPQDVLDTVKALLSTLTDINMVHLGISHKALSSLEGTVHQRVKYINNRNRDSDKTTTGVWLGTMHSSKGCEFTRVWLPHINDQIIPSAKSTDIEEERRLFYVAMTRAKQQLVISTVNLRITPERQTQLFPSPFFHETGIEPIRYDKNEPPNENAE